MMRYYIALVEQDAGLDVSVSFPDFPGCRCSGRNLSDAIAMARDVLRVHIDCLLQAGQGVPEPASFETVMRAHREQVLEVARGI